jgi:hypothetical protein
MIAQAADEAVESVEFRICRAQHAAHMAARVAHLRPAEKGRRIAPHRIEAMVEQASAPGCGDPGRFIALAQDGEDLFRMMRCRDLGHASALPVVVFDRIERASLRCHHRA